MRLLDACLVNPWRLILLTRVFLQAIDAIGGELLVMEEVPKSVLVPLLQQAGVGVLKQAKMFKALAPSLSGGGLPSSGSVSAPECDARVVFG